MKQREGMERIYINGTEKTRILKAPLTVTDRLERRQKCRLRPTYPVTMAGPADYLTSLGRLPFRDSGTASYWFARLTDVARASFCPTARPITHLRLLWLDCGRLWPTVADCD